MMRASSPRLQAVFRRPFITTSKLADHGRVRSTQQDSAGQQLGNYIKFLNDAGVNLNEAPFTVDYTSASSETDSETDSDEGGSQTEAEAQEIKHIIADLQNSNESLQKELKHLVSGLSELLKNIQVTSKSDKALLAALPAALAEATQQTHQQINAVGRWTGQAPSAPNAQGIDGANVNVSCVMQHPGALCCTRSTVREDSQSKEITITMETTARATDDATARGLLTDEELGGLAAQALLSSAAEHLCNRTRSINAHARSKSEKERHDELCAILQSGEIIEAISNPVVSQFGHESFIVNLQDEVTGKRLRALFKPRIEGDADGWHRAPMEFAAYRLNLLLGLDYVPPVAYRTGGVTFKVI
jgi:hypothetical protein